MEIPDEIAAALKQALVHARSRIPAIWSKREGSRRDSALADDEVYALAVRAGLAPECKPKPLPNRPTRAELMVLLRRRNGAPQDAYATEHSGSTIG
jgi:hypothetical protein